MNTSPESSILQDRAQMLARTRHFFAERGVLEVDTPLLSPTAPIDAHIEVMEVKVLPNCIGYLHSSVEYAHKRLLSQGIGDIYQLGHVFRFGECGRLHNPEFTMIEWYRTTLPYDAFIEETLDLIRLFLGNLPAEHLTYCEALQTYAGIDALSASQIELYNCAVSHALGIATEASEWDRDTLLNLLFSLIVEPRLNTDRLTVIYDYPPSQAALAKTEKGMARRFEIYAQNIELANGYDELTDAAEQRRRLLAANETRRQMGKAPLPIDEAFLVALEKGLPDCRGVAVGFDRLMLLRHGAHSLAEVFPFSWKDPFI